MYSISNDDEGFHDVYDSFYRQESDVTQLWYLPFLILTIISGGVLVLFMWDNAVILRLQHIWVFVDYFKFSYFVLIYSPLVPMYRYCVVPVTSVDVLVVNGISKQFSSGITLQSFATNVTADSEDNNLSVTEDVPSTEVTINSTELSRSYRDSQYFCWLLLSCIVSVPMLPLALLSEICLADIQSYLCGCEKVTDQIHETFAKAFERRKLSPIYFFQILAALNLINEARINQSKIMRASPEEGQLICQTEVVYVGYALVGIGVTLAVGYFLLKEVKFCGAFVFNLANVAAHLYAVVVLRTTYFLNGHYHSSDDVYGDYVFDDFTTEESSTALMSYDRLIIGFTLAVAVAVLFFYDNAVMIKDRHIWVLADYLRLLWFILVRYPLSAMQRTFCSSATR
jgi:hypothetical protein